MSSSPSTPSTSLREASRQPAAPRRRRFGFFRAATFLVLLLLVILFEPNTFRFVVGQLIRVEAWRSGIDVQIGSIEGSVLEPLTLRNSVWIYESATGPVTRVEVAAATGEFSWRNLLPRSSGRWFQDLTIRGLTGKIQLPQEIGEFRTEDTGLGFKLPKFNLFDGHWLPAPERVEAREVDFIFQSNRDFVRLADTELTISRIEPGKLRAGQIVIHQPWITRTFRDVRGTTAIQEARLEVADLTLEPEVQVRSFSVELDDLARGQPKLKLDLAAFGGAIRVAAQTLPDERRFSVDATGTFTQINVAKLATFLGISDAAGGLIKDGKFTFRGPPQQAARATASLRLEATNFQWETRQWDSLVLGAVLMDGRVQVPELALVQGHNRLQLTGEMPLPAPNVQWWQSEFNVTISARIENLTELSALMLPEFKYAAGKGTIDGSIRGKNQEFNGQLIISGSKLRWRNAPIEELHAGVNLNGNEFQLTNISLFNNGDYIRGSGVVNIIGDKQYWGEVHGSIEDLAKYAALLQKPIVPEPLAGGAVIDWEGEGSAKGHSGKFSARLRKLRSLGASAALLHPINADLDGSYSPGMMQFSRFALSDDNSSFTANVGVGNKALSLQGIKLYNHQTLWLEGDAVLPLDVWNAWPNTTLATLLDDQTVSGVNLTAHHLELGQAAALTGWNFPIQGVVDGNVTASGPLAGLKTGGSVTLTNAKIPLGWTGEIISDVNGVVTFDGATLATEKLAGRHAKGNVGASGKVDFKNVRDPVLDLKLVSSETSLELFKTDGRSFVAKTSFEVNLSGPFSAAKAEGEVRLLELTHPGPTKLDGLISGEGWPEWPTPLVLADGPWNSWSLNLAVSAKDPLKSEAPVRIWMPVTEAYSQAYLGGFVTDLVSVDPHLKIVGPVEKPALVGEIVFRDGSPQMKPDPIKIDEVTIDFREGFNTTPSINGTLRGVAYGEPYELHLIGPLAHPMRVFEFDSPLTRELITRSLQPPPISSDVGEALRFGVAPEFLEGVTVVNWTPIPTPLPNLEPAPAPVDAATPAPPAVTAPMPAAAPTAAPVVPAPAAPAAAPAPAPAAATPAPVPATAAPAIPAPAPAAAPVPPAAPVPAPAAAAPVPAPAPPTGAKP